LTERPIVSYINGAAAAWKADTQASEVRESGVIDSEDKSVGADKASTPQALEVKANDPAKMDTLIR
jgi:hypothetical protein